MKPSKTREPDIIRAQRTGKPTPPIAGFLQNYLGNTLLTYRAGVLDYFDYLIGKRLRGKKGVTPESMAKYEAFARTYLADERDYAGDYLRYIKHLNESDVPPKTAHTRYIAVREFLGRYDIELDKQTTKTARRLKPRGGRRTNIEYASREILGEILHHCDAQFRAFVLFLLSSGCRLAEPLRLKWVDITFPDRPKYPDKPASVFIRKSKEGNSRTVYITRECETALLEWKKVSGNYQKFALQRSENLKNPKNVDTDRVFQFSRTTVYERWHEALKDAEHYNVDVETHRVRLNLHRLRNFFSVQISSAAGIQIADVLMDHYDRYGGAYSGRPEPELEAAYLKAEPLLTIGANTAPAIQAMEIETLKKLNQNLLERMTKMELAYKNRVAEMIFDARSEFDTEEDAKGYQHGEDYPGQITEGREIAREILRKGSRTRAPRVSPEQSSAITRKAKEMWAHTKSTKAPKRKTTKR
jgi:integrase